MVKNLSFTDYIKNRFDNNFWVVAEEYLNENTEHIESLINNFTHGNYFVNFIRIRMDILLMRKD